MNKFIELRKKYSKFIYHRFEFTKDKKNYYVTYFFEIVGLSEFKTSLVLPYSKEVDECILKRLIYNIGLVEAISYYKITCATTFEIKCGSLNQEKQKWWRDLIYNGLGEFMYVNQIDISKEDLFEFKCDETNNPILQDECQYKNYLVPVGGGKDSVVSLELLNNYTKKDNIATFHINTSKATDDVIELFNNTANDICVKRNLDSKMLDYNAKGFLNGHTPFSALVAFVSYTVAFLNGFKYIVLSNESSANEPTVKGTKINHQYSKSIEFEKGFNEYIKTITDSDIYYYSLLRPLNELQIAKLFSKNKKYFSKFRSCNVGSKTDTWCGECPKCLFVYIILSPFVDREHLNSIFSRNLLDKETLDNYYRQLVGIDENKPFECVGTRNEVNAAMNELIKKGDKSKLVQRYKEYVMSNSSEISEILGMWDNNHIIPEEELVERVKLLINE